jgi:DnaJ homolog subfamily C member 11
MFTRKKVGLASILDDVPEIQHAMVIHSWETKIDDFTFLTLKGTVLAKNGLGSGSITLKGKRIIDPSLWSEASLALGDEPAANLKVVKKFSEDKYATINVNANSISKLPTLSFLFGRNLSETTTAFIQYIPDLASMFGLEGNDTSCMIGMNHASGEIQSSVDVVASMRQSQISISQTRPLGLFRGRAQISLTSGGITFSLNGDKLVGKSTRVGFGVDCAYQSGVAVKLKVSRLGQKLSIPILISQEADIKMALYTFVFPVLTYVALDKLFIKSWREKKRLERLERIRVDNAEILEKRRKEATQAVMLLSDSIARKLEAEESREGLVIISALYGKLPPSDLESVRVLSPQGIQELASSIKAQFKFLKKQELPVSHQDEFIDVTIPVQALVSNGQLHISGGHSKSHLIGFYDPCYGERKELRVTYQFQGRLHQVTVSDKQPLAAPLRGIY